MKLELLNSEGPILTAIKINEDNTKLKLVDQYKKEIPISKQDLIDFIDGRTSVVDSQDKVWHYPSESDGMKQSNFTINEFLKTIE